MSGDGPAMSGSGQNGEYHIGQKLCARVIIRTQEFAQESAPGFCRDPGIPQHHQ
jgi:hypothetical protein